MFLTWRRKEPGALQQRFLWQYKRQIVVMTADGDDITLGSDVDANEQFNYSMRMFSALSLI